MSEICFLVVSSNYSFVHKRKTQMIPLFVVVVLVRVGEGGGCLLGFCCLVCLLVCGFVVVVCCWFCVVVGVGVGSCFSVGLAVVRANVLEPEILCR